MVTAPAGTITWTEYDILGRPIETWVGTDATDAEPGDPGNGGNDGNNMKRVAATFYDGASSSTPVVGDSTVTQDRRYYTDDDYYATDMKYDEIDRLVRTRGSDKRGSIISVAQDANGAITSDQVYFADDSVFNNLNNNGTLQARSVSYFDARGRVYKTVSYEAPTSGTAHSMTSKTWYDLRGRAVKTENPNGLFQKTKYDTLGRATASYVCYDNDNGDTEGGSAYTGAGSVEGDTVISQTKMDYDASGGVWLVRSGERLYDGAPNTGELSLANENIRDTYTVNWFDLLGRTTKTVFYGTNGGTAITSKTSSDFDPDASGSQYYAAGGPSPNSSRLCMVSTIHYDSGLDESEEENEGDGGDQYHWGQVDQVTDNAERITRTKWGWDGTHPLVQTIENSVASNPGSDQDRITEQVTDSAGRLWKLIAVNGTRPDNDQVTRYLYESPLNGAWPTNVIYPDSSDTTSSGTDQVKTTYNRLGRPITTTDQRGVEHAFEYVANGNPGAGRLLSDAVTSLPGTVDGTVRRIQTSYDSRGRVEKVTSYDAATSGIVVNEVKFTFADNAGTWGSLIKIEQANVGAVTAGPPATPAIEYAYADGADGNGNARYLRLTSVTYPGPSTRTAVYYNYASSGDGAVLSRLDNIAADSSGNSKFAAYTYLGAGTISKVEHPGVTNGLTLNYDTSGGHAYAGLDRFSRVADQTWKVNGSAVDRYTYGYDASGNRSYRANEQSSTRGELYAYDGLNRLQDAQRGTLNGNKDAITALAFRQFWGHLVDTSPVADMDKLGNWAGFLQDVNGDATWDLAQTREHNLANEITDIAGGSWIEPVYDAAGNMVEGPSGLNPTVRHKFIYDAWNRLVKVTDSSDPAVTIAIYRFNGLNHRARKFVPTGTNEWTVTEYHYNPNWQVLEERKAVEVSWDETEINTKAGPTPAASGTNVQYVWDQRYIDAPVCRFRDTDADGVPDDETLYYCNDANMNVTALVAANGTVVERYVYDPYGNPRIYDGSWNSLSASAYANEIRYCGYRYDPETGYYHVRNRMYQPLVGRWMQRDPVGYIDGISLCQYVQSRPTMRMDPDGTNPLAGIVAGLLPCVAGALTSSLTEFGIQLCKCCYSQVGWRLYNCRFHHLTRCNPDNCRLAVSAAVGCLAGYLPGGPAPKSVSAAILLAEKVGAKALAKWLGTLDCP